MCSLLILLIVEAVITWPSTYLSVQFWTPEEPGCLGAQNNLLGYLRTTRCLPVTRFPHALGTGKQSY